MHWLALLLCCSATLALPLPDEVDSEETRKVLGSSVVTSVSVIMDLGNGTQAVFTNASSGSRLEKPGGVGSPVEMASPDHYQYYSFDGSGNLIKRFMTKDDVSSIIATNQKHNTQKTDPPTFYHSMPSNIGDLAFETKDEEVEPENLQQSQLRVVANVQNLLKSQISSQGHVRPPMPTHISPEASASWSMILPSFFGNEDTTEETLDQTPEETEVKYNDTEPSLLNSTEKVPIPFSQKPESVTKVENLESTITSSESTSNLDDSTTSSAAAHLNQDETSSESQMLGDAPAASDHSTEASQEDLSEESTYPSSKTDSEPVHSTESHSETDGHQESQSAEAHHVTESIEDDQSTESMPEMPSTVYEMISTSNAVSSETTLNNMKENPQPSSEDKTLPPILHKEEDQHALSSENHKSEIVNNAPSGGNLLITTESTISTSETHEAPSSPDSAMLADSPIADVIYKHSSTNSDQSEENVPSESMESSSEHITQASVDSNEKNESEESQPSDEMEKIPSISSEETQSTSERVSEKNEGSTTSSSTEHTEDDEKNTAESVENSDGNLSFEDHNDNKQSGQFSTSTDSNEEEDEHLTPAEKTENVDSSSEKESTSQEIENLKEEAYTELAQVSSDEKVKYDSKLESNEQSSESTEAVSVSTSGSQPSPAETKTTSVEAIHSTSEEAIVSTESTAQNESEQKPIKEELQADAPHVDKLVETPNSDLANTLLISEENHSSFNQVDLSSSSSKESLASKVKNNSIAEPPSSSKQDDKNKTVEKSQTDNNTSSTSSQLQNSNSNEVSESVANSSEGNNSSETIKTDVVSLSSDDESNVSASPVKTTDTSSSTPEVTEESDSNEEETGKVEVLSDDESEEDGSGEVDMTKTTPTSSTSTMDEIHLPHNLDESVASIVSQIIHSNASPGVEPDSSASEEMSGHSDLSSFAQESGVSSTLDSQENSATEIVVTSVSTSKSTESSSSEVVKTSADNSNEEGSGGNGLCGEDASCSDEDNLDNSDAKPADNDKLSAGSESVGITTKYDYQNSTSESATINDDDNGIVDKTNDTSQSTHGPSNKDDKIATENLLLQTHSATKGGLGEGGVELLTTTVTDRTKTDADSLTTPSIMITESGEIIPISGEDDGSGDKHKTDYIVQVTSPAGSKACNKEGSGSDDVTDSCEDEGDVGSGNGPDSTENLFEGSGYPTSGSYAGEEFTTDGYNIQEDKNQISGENSASNDDDLHDIMKYASSIKDIGITNAPKYDEVNDTSSSESPVPYHEDLLLATQQYEGSAQDVDSNGNASLPENMTKPNHTMDLFEYINSDLDFGVTNAYNSSESDTTPEPSVTEPNRDETSEEDIDGGHGMIKFKYVDSDEVSTTDLGDESEMTTEEVASTNSNEIESTTVFDMDVMMNDQPVDTVSESGESFIPYVEDVSNDKNSTSDYDKIKVSTKKPIPQKAQKDDTINNVKLKPHSNGGYPTNVVQQHPQKLKKENNTQSEDKNWTKVEVISHLTNSTPNAQQTSSNKSQHVEKPENDASFSPPYEGRPQFYSLSAVELQPAPQESLGLEASTANLVEDVQQFAELCNELAFKLWVSMTEKSVTAARSLVMSPFAITSLLAMIFLGAKGSTSGQMNDMLKLDDMMTFNPHQVFRNVTESVVQQRNPGVRTAAFVRELYSDQGKGPLLEFYKQRASQFYDGMVEEADFTNIGDVLRRRTNLQVKKQTGGRVPEYLRGSSLSLQPPLAAFSANIFQTDCRGASTQGRDGEMYFTILPTTRQRRLVPIPSAVFKSGFLAGYEPGLDATVVSLGMQDSSISTLFVMPGQQGQTAPGDGLSRLEARLLGSAFTNRAWSHLLRSLLHRPGLEVQFPRFSHRSLLNMTNSLQSMGLNELFNPGTADLQGLSGFTSPLHVSDLIQINTFTTCGEEVIGSRHHVEIYPSTPQRAGRDSEQDLTSVPLVSRPRQARVDPNLETTGFEEAVPQEGIYSMPLALRPRQARLPDTEQPPPRLKFDRPFLYFVRHNPTGFILHMGRFNPRLIH